MQLRLAGKGEGKKQNTAAAAATTTTTRQENGKTIETMKLFRLVWNSWRLSLLVAADCYYY